MEGGTRGTGTGCDEKFETRRMMAKMTLCQKLRVRLRETCYRERA